MRVLLTALLVSSLFVFGCNGESNPADSGTDANDGDACVDDGDSGGADDGGGDAGVPCQDYSECDGKLPGCANATCDLNPGACRCVCSEGECGDEHCVAGYCVGCGDDEHCKDHDCAPTPQTPNPRCRLDTQTCVCGGDCGDGNCDSYEEALGSCPQDCSGPCQDGEVRSFSCMSIETVEWCTCVNSAWDCLDDPTTLCHGENRCIQMGGQCAGSVDDCYEGTPAAEAHGCLDPSPVCCLPTQCTGPGVSYYPYLGLCCPGLRAVPSRMPLSEPLGDIEGVYCFDTCWALICAPCGDGACQLYLGENFCTCPEDCPHPPYTFACSTVSECGTAYCRQDGATCTQHTPECVDKQCRWTAQDLAGHLCNPVTRACEQV